MSIRLRLATWYTAFLATMLVLFAPTAYFLLEREMSGEVDRWLAPIASRVLLSVSENTRSMESLRGSGGSELTAAQILSAVTAIQDLDLTRFSSAGIFVQLLDPSGRTVAKSANLEGRTIPVPDHVISMARTGGSSSFTVEANGERHRGYLLPIPGDQGPRGFVLALRSLREMDRALGAVRELLLAGSILGLGLAVGVGWVIARKSLRPLEEITQTARSIAQSQGFSQRLKVGETRDEVGELQVTFNEMLASLDEAYAAQRRFVADASHELRSPLTSIRSNIDILRRTLDAPREDRAEALADVAAELERLTRLTSDLLLLARADAGHKIEMSELSLNALVADVQRQMDLQAQGVNLSTETTGPVAVVVGNAVWLKQLLLILLDNALKYTPSGGTVRLFLEQDRSHAILTVRDTGIGIAEEDLPHVFERFFRADKARARDEGGAGLGLSIARWIAQEHQGTLGVESKPGEGTTFTLVLPLASSR